MFQEVIFREEYARAGAPGRAGLIGEGLLGPTLIHFGSKLQQERFLPRIVAGPDALHQRDLIVEALAAVAILGASDLEIVLSVADPEP